MTAKLPDVEDLTQVPEETRTSAVNVELPEEVRAALQAQADQRGVTLEEYVRWLAFTAASVAEAGGSSSSSGGKA